MAAFSTGVVASMAIGGTVVSTCLWRRPFYGLFSGLIQSVITIAIKELFGQKASYAYIAAVVVVTIGVIGKEALKLRDQETEKP